MKNLTFYAFLIMCFMIFSNAHAQVGINTDGTDPDPSSMLDIKSNDKGLLIPRMSMTEITLVKNPANGLIVYNTSDGKLYVFDQSSGEWKEVAYGAGIVPQWNCGMPIIDNRDDHVYNTIQTGEQCWFQENLNYGEILDNEDEALDNGIIEKHCFDDDPINCDNYGGMYRWSEAMEYTEIEGTQGICPNGWHIPTDGEMTVLDDFLGGEDVAGGKLKSMDTEPDPHPRWDDPNTGASNESLFSAYPCGYRHEQIYWFLGMYGYLWSSTAYYEYGNTSAYCRAFSYTHDNSYRNPYSQYYSIALRCIKD